MLLVHDSRHSAFGPRRTLAFPALARSSRAEADPLAEPAGPPAAAHAVPPPSAPEIVVTRGKQIYLRTFTPPDLWHLDGWVDDPDLERLVGSEFLQLYRAYEKDPSFFEAVLMDPTQVVLVIVPYRERRPVGVVRLFGIHQAEGYASIETIIGDPLASRRGYGVQASRLMAYWGVDTLSLRRLESRVYAYNPLSINTLKRNGFTQEGVLRQAACRDGRYWDIIVFGILKDEIEEQRRKDKYLVPPDDVDGNGRDPS
ncbi:MAG: GNAT family N-acetyltransferase [Candidatus Rokuibacteriota bacterium]